MEPPVIFGLAVLFALFGVAIVRPRSRPTVREQIERENLRRLRKSLLQARPTYAPERGEVIVR